MSWKRPLALLLVTFLAACGGSSGSSGSTATAEVAEEEQGDRTEGGRRRAQEGAACDYGGVADHTCLRGLDCCYGPPANPGEQGSCMPECPQY